MKLYVGTYTDSGSKGIYVYDTDKNYGEFDLLQSVEQENPSYIALSPNGRMLYAVTENGDGPSYISSYEINVRGELRFRNMMATSQNGLCHVAVSPDGRWLLAAAYSSGGLSVLKIREDGSIGEEVKVLSFDDGCVENISHIHCSAFIPDGRYVYITDLGRDSIYRYVYNADSIDKPLGDIKIFCMRSGSGPRHIAFGKNGNFMYVITELAATVEVFDITAGELLHLQTHTITKEGGDGGDIVISPDGRLLFASIREKSNCVAVFAIGDNGLLRKVSYVNTNLHPRSILLSPCGAKLLVASMKENNVRTYDISSEKGELYPSTGIIRVLRPVCIIFGTV
ncbi:MAG: lactonase family protein [Rikenellaceae bacterium]|nr:lactonase family protein [Rikenellaceae bacterium]